MDGGNEQRVAIKFCFKAGLSETLVLVQKAYGNEALNRSNVFRWYSQFRDGRELVEDDERGGRPKSTRTEVNIAAVSDLVENGRRISSRMIAESLNIPKTVVLRMLKEELGKRKLCVHFVPHWHLSKGKIESHFTKTLSRWLMQTNFFKQNYYGRLDLVFCLWPDTKRQSSEWVGETSPRQKKLKFQRSRIKTMLINFFDSQGAVHKAFLPEGKNSKCRNL